MYSSGFARCAECEDRIGVYEPIVVVEPNTTRMTAIAREPGLHNSASRLLHVTCAAALEARGEPAG